MGQRDSRKVDGLQLAAPPVDDCKQLDRNAMIDDRTTMLEFDSC